MHDSKSQPDKSCGIGHDLGLIMEANSDQGAVTDLVHIVHHIGGSGWGGGLVFTIH